MKYLTILLSLLLSITANADECPRSPYVYYVEVTKVYDGDTITADIDLGFHTWRKGETLRLHEIDAPEVKGKSRSEGLRSRDWLRSKILNKRIMVQTIKTKNKLRGKYGRYIAVLYTKTGDTCTNLNHELVRLGYATHRKY